MSDIRKYIALVEAISAESKSDGKMTNQDYQAVVNHFEDNYHELDSGVMRGRTQTIYENPQRANVNRVWRYVENIEPGHFIKKSEMNYDPEAKHAWTHIYNADKKPVLTVVYDRFSSVPVGVYMYSHHTRDEALGRKAEQDWERHNDTQRKLNKGEY